MNKEKINSKIEDLKAELQNLEQLANEPEKRTPEAADVWLENDGTNHIVVKSNDCLASAMFGIGRLDGHLYDGNEFSSDPFSGISEEDFTYLGKFPEVYVKISDVRAALSIKDQWGDSILSSTEDGYCGATATRKALRKLNII
jgi:hypothetical protein